MKKRNKLVTLIWLFVSVFTFNVSWAQGQIEKRNLKVLYVGGSGNWSFYKTPVLEQDDIKRRMLSFEAMLKKYFSEVKVIKAPEYNAMLSENYDVTIIDAVEKSKADGVFPYNFSKPVLFVGETSSLMGRKIGLKFDWYCLCLAGDAHSVRTNHEIFKGPFPVNISFEEKATPDGALGMDYLGVLPKTMPLWSVQTTSYEDGLGFRPGLVGHGAGFEDSPDAEFISGGSSAKDISAVAIGRHGSFLQWGFSASPEYLTPQAQVVFANAVVYISKFNGQHVIARKLNERIQTTHDYEERMHMASEKGLDGINYYSAKAQNFSWKIIKKYNDKRNRGEKLTPEEEVWANRPVPEEPEPMGMKPYLEATQGQLYEKFGADFAAYKKYYKSNIGYFNGREGMKIDEDLKTLKIKNNSPKLLPTAIGMLEKGKNTELAKRILDRYTLLNLTTAQEWRRWYEKNKSKLFFTESGGYYYLVNSADPKEPSNNYEAKRLSKLIKSVPAGETSDQDPVSISAIQTKEDGSSALLIRVKIHPGYHIYEFVSQKDPYIKTEVNLDLPAGIAKSRDMEKPKSRILNMNGTSVYENDVVYIQELKGRGEGEAKFKISYQVCNDDICLPPTEKEIKVKLQM